MIRAVLAGSAAMAVTALAAVPAEAARCRGVPTTSYDGTYVRMTLELDLEPCGAVGKSGNVTMRTWMTRTDGVTGERTRGATYRTRCKRGVHDCTVRGRWAHPATEHATYGIEGFYETDGSTYIAGTLLVQVSCTSVAATLTNCSLPL